MTVLKGHRPHIGVGVLVWKQGQLLLGKRLCEHDEDCWQFPGGHLESGETVIECAQREVAEETGLMVSNCQPAGYSNRGFVSRSGEYFTLYVSATCESGEARVMEIDKCARWQWFSPARLPLPLFAPITLYLKQYPDLRVFQFEP